MPIPPSIGDEVTYNEHEVVAVVKVKGKAVIKSRAHYVLEIVSVLRGGKLLRAGKILEVTECKDWWFTE